MTRGGLPLGYEVFPGSSCEVDGFIPTLCAMHPVTAQAVFVADAGMGAKDNPDGLGAQGCRFVVGARLHNLPKALTGRVLDVSRYHGVPGSDLKVGAFPSRGPPPGGVVEREACPQGRP